MVLAQSKSVLDKQYKNDDDDDDGGGVNNNEISLTIRKSEPIL